MAKKSSIAKNQRRIALSEKHREARKALRKTSVDLTLSDDERWEATKKLQSMPRNGSPCRVVNRCYMTGRPRGVLRKFGLSRIAFRELALSGKVPGVTKSSW